MKIIVTGGAGFIGSNFVHHMVNKYPDYEIINLDLLTYAGNLENLKPVEDKPNYKFVKGDIADRKFIFELFEKEKPDVVVNFAAESHVDRSITDPEAFVRTNVMGTTTLLDACRTYGIKRYHPVSYTHLDVYKRQAFMKTLYDEDTYVEFLHATPVGMLPAIKGIADTDAYKDDDTIRQFTHAEEVLTAAADIGTAFGYEHGPNVQAGIMQNNHVIEDMFQDIITNGTDVKTAAKTAEDKLNALFETAE